MQRLSLTARLLIVLILLPAAAACRPEPSPKAESSSDQITPRLAVLSPALADILCELGHSEHIVARHSYDAWSDAALPVAGDETGLDYEVLLTVEPTQVILQDGAGEPPRRLRELCAQRDCTIVEVPLLTLADVRSAVAQLDRLARGAGNHAALSPTAAALLADMDATWRPQPAVEALGRTLMLTWINPPAAVGPGSFHYAMLKTMGAEPIPTQGSAYIRLTLEDIVALDPATIVLLLPGAAAPPHQLLGAVGKLDIEAVRRGQVLVVRQEKALLPSGQLVEVAQTIVEAAKQQIGAGNRQ